MTEINSKKRNIVSYSDRGLTTKKVGRFENERLAGFKTKVGKLGPTRGSPPPLNSKLLAGLRW